MLNSSVILNAGSVEHDEHHGLNPLVTRLKIWSDHNLPCAGKYVRGICIFSTGDLPTLDSSPCMFANKFHKDYHPLAYDCMEKRIFDNVLRETKGQSQFNDSYYKRLDFVKHHV